MQLLSTPFVFMCPLRRTYAGCVINHQGLYFASPGWAPGGTCQYTDSSGSSWRDFTVSLNGVTSDLYHHMVEALDDGEDFPPTPLPGCEFPNNFDWGEMWVPLGWHDRWAERPVPDELYARWEAGCDVLFGSSGAHALVVRAARARRKKQLIAKRRRDRRKGGSASQSAKLPHLTHLC